MSSDPSLTHIHKRRFLMFVEESIAESTQWIVHEPSDERLWGKIVRSVSAFLRRQWLEGALFGASEAEAYYVKCDAETNPPEVRAAFQVITETLTMFKSQCLKCGAVVESVDYSDGAVFFSCGCGRSWRERRHRSSERNERKPVARKRRTWGGKFKPWRRFDKFDEYVV